MKKELERLKKALRWKCVMIPFEQYFKKYQIGKGNAKMAYFDSGFKNSLLSMTD